MARYLATLVSLVLVLAVPLRALALGLGEIDLKSGLNQRFVAEIPVTSESAIDLTDLKVELASRDTFNQFGLDRAAFLSDFQFVLVRRGDDSSIQVTSTKPVVEPFVTLLLEIAWPQGRLLREYTVLLDPPAFAAAEVETAVQEPVAGPAPIPESAEIVRSAPPAPALTVEPAETVAPVEQVAEPLPAAEPVRAEPVPAVEPVAAAEPVAAVESAPTVEPVAEVEPAPAVEPESLSSSSAPPPMADDTYGPVRRNDTLWAIAGRVSTDASVNRNQMMLAIFRANPEAFAGNINRLKAGVILRIPDADQLERLGPRQAQAEVQRQNTDWKASVDDTPRLRLVPPPEAGAAGESPAAQVAADVEREALQQRILGLEVDLSDSERLIALRDQELQALQQQLAALEERLDASAAIVQQPADAEPLAPGDVGVGDEADVATGVEAGAGSEAPDIAAAGPETVAGTEEVIEEPSLPPTPAPIIGADAPPVPSDVVTTAQGEESSWLAALFSNIWLYVGLVLVSLAALYVAYRSPAKAKQGGATRLDQLDDAGELDHVSGEPSLGPSSMSAEDESFIVEEVRPAERTMQQDVSAEVDSGAAYDEPATDFVADEFDEPATDFVVEEFDESGDSDSGWDMPAAEDESEPEAYSPAAAELDEESPLERTISISAAADLDEADPIAEADFHMAYGLYDQAADLLTKSVAAEPHRKDLRLKLLEVYFIWENGEGFLKEAKLLQESLEGQADPDWNKVLIMGKQICPDEALFLVAPDGSGEAGAMDLALNDDEQISDDYDVDIPLADVTEESLNISVEDPDPDEDMSSLDMTNIDRINPDLLNFDLPGDDSTAEAQTLESAMDNLTEDTFDVDLDLADVDFDSEDPTIETPTADMPALKAAAEEEDSLESPTFEPTQVIQKIEPDESGADAELEVTDLEVTDNFIDLENHDLPDMPSLDLAAESLRIDMADDTNIGPADPEIDEPSVNFDLRGAGFDDDDEAALFEPTEVMRHSDEDGSGINDATVEQFTGDTAAQSGSDFEYEGATMTEVGTKLDLARAYIDMGDPEGARSILTEVLEEAGDTQRQQAQQLLSDLG